MSKFRITLEIETPSDPNEWDWDNLIEPTENESYSIVDIVEVK